MILNHLWTPKYLNSLIYLFIFIQLFAYTIRKNILTNGSLLDGGGFNFYLNLSIFFMFVEPAMNGECVALSLGRNVDFYFIQEPARAHRSAVVSNTYLLQL